MKNKDKKINPLEESLETSFIFNTYDDQSLDFHPKTFEDYLGQSELKNKLSIYTQAAAMRNEPLDHLLLFGPPGLGKTTLATIMAHVMKVDIKICTGPMLERSGDLVAILSGLQPKDILFIDEIHRMPVAVEEILYSAMEHFKIDVIIGQGAGAQTINLPLQPFTLIGATTKTGSISAPLRSRFGITERHDFYNENDLTAIIHQNAHYLGICLSDKSALLIAKAARGTPRIAKKILRRVRDFIQVKTDKKTLNTQTYDSIVQEALSFLGIDQDGLTTLDHAILKAILLRFNGGPVGLETLASIVGEDKDTIEDVYEPFLMREGYLEKTPRGRQIAHHMLIKLKKNYTGQQTI